MQKNGARIIFSAGDLVRHPNCRYLTHLDLKAVQHPLVAWRSPPMRPPLQRDGQRSEAGHCARAVRQSSGKCSKRSGLARRRSRMDRPRIRNLWAIE